MLSRSVASASGYSTAPAGQLLNLSTERKPSPTPTPAKSVMKSLISKIGGSSTGSAPAPPPKTAKKAGSHDVVGQYGAQFAREVALTQFLEGGSIERNIQRVHKSHAKAAARAGIAFPGAECGAVRGAHGELFRDAADEEANRGLLSGAYKGQRVRPTSSRSSSMTSEESEAAWRVPPRSRSSPPTNSRAAFFDDPFNPRRK